MALELATYGGDFLIQGGEWILDPGGSCCCGGCCLSDLSDTLCATMVTTNCTGGETAGTTTANLTLVYSATDPVVKVWQGVIAYCPSGCGDWYIQIGGECSAAGDVEWFLCHDSCFDAAYKCEVDPPDFGHADWTTLGNVPSAEGCIFDEHTGIPLSSCGDCEFTLTVADGACP